MEPLRPMLKPTREQILKYCLWLNKKHVTSADHFFSSQGDYPVDYAIKIGLRDAYGAAVAKNIASFIQGDPVAWEIYKNNCLDFEPDYNDHEPLE